MRRNLRWALAIVCGVTLSASIEGATEEGELPRPTPTPAMLDELLALAGEFEVPLPPAEAPLVRLHTGWWRMGEAKDERKAIFSLGFLLEKAAGNRPATVLTGPLLLKRESEDDPEQNPQPWRAELTAFSELSFRWPVTFEQPTALILAVQCHARGETELALQLAKIGLEVEPEAGGPGLVQSGRSGWRPHRQPPTRSVARGDTPKAALASAAWTGWLNQLYFPESDWPKAARAMRRILARAPEIADEAREDLLRGLEATLAAPPEEPGTVEADIADLGRSLRHARDDYPDDDPVERKLLRRGFAAVPALIEHLDDRRLTRSLMLGFNNFRTQPRRLGELVADVLQKIAGDELGRHWLGRQLGDSAAKATVRAWWKKAQAEGEERYLVRRLREPLGEYEGAREGVLLQLEVRYPRHLPEIYRQFLRTGKVGVGGWALAEALGRCSLPAEQRSKALRPGLSAKDDQVWRPALRALQECDPAAADVELLTRLRRLPTKIQGGGWKPAGLDLNREVIRSTSDEVWAEFGAYLRRTHVCLRLEMMEGLIYTPSQQKPRALELLAELLDDTEVRVLEPDGSSHAEGETTRYLGPCGYRDPARVAVQDVAARWMGGLFEEPGWQKERDGTEAQRAEFRARMKSRWEKETAKSAPSPSGTAESKR